MPPLAEPLPTWLLLLAAAGLDRLLGDPQGCYHPVQAMGALIQGLRRLLEPLAADRPWALRLAGGLITLVVVGLSGLAGWAVEQWARSDAPGAMALGLPLLVLGLASVLAGRSLEQAVLAVVRALPDLAQARARLAWIVGRDVAHLPEADILRAAAETAAENGVDGLLAPLFWLVLGGLSWQLGAMAPGPLALGWIFKAASTLDSMLGYRRGRLRWLGTAGARLDDLLTWLPTRLVAFSLPLVAGQGRRCAPLGRLALRQGAPDPSPNAGVSMAAFALNGRVRLGGGNHYGGQWRAKPVLAAGLPAPDQRAVERLLQLAARLEWLWLVLALPLLLLPAATQATGSGPLAAVSRMLSAR